jgi:hypothetical protein
VPCGRGHPSGFQKEEPRWRHACRHRLRTVLHQPPTTSVHRGSRRRALLASRRITRLRFQTRIRRSIPIVGAATRPGGRSAGSWCPSGYGTRLLELGHQLHPDPVRTVSRLLLPSRRRTSTPPRIHPLQRPHRGMLHPPRLPPGKLAVSPAQTFLTRAMERSGIRQGSRFGSRSGVGKLRGVYVWCMRPVLAVAAHVRSANSVNGKATRRLCRARSACSCIRWWSGRCRFSGVTGVVGLIDEHACNWCVTNALRSTWSPLDNLPLLRRRQCFLARFGHILVSTGTNVSLAMDVLRALARSQSSCSAFLTTLPSGWV